MSEFTVKYCIEVRGTRLSVMSGNDEDACKEPQFTLLVTQSREFVSRYFCSYKFMMPGLADLNRKNCSSLARLHSSYSTNKKDISP